MADDDVAKDRTMQKRLSLKFWIGSGAAIASGVLGILTIVSKEWIEVLFGADPDGGSGLLEWSIVAVLLGIAVACSMVARHEWKLARPMPN